MGEGLGRPTHESTSFKWLRDAISAADNFANNFATTYESIACMCTCGELSARSENNSYYMIMGAVESHYSM